VTGVVPVVGHGFPQVPVTAGPVLPWAPTPSLLPRPQTGMAAGQRLPGGGGAGEAIAPRPSTPAARERARQLVAVGDLALQQGRDGPVAARAALAEYRAAGRFDQEDADIQIRQAILHQALGQGRDADRAIVVVCRQGAEAREAALALLAAYRSADASAQELLLPVLAKVGGPEVLAMVDALVNDPDPAARKRGLDALSRWPDAAVKDRLLGLLEKASDEGEKRLLVNTLIRIAPIPDNGLQDPAKLALLASTMPLCSSDEERRRVLERSAAIRTVETLRFVRPYLDEPPLAESAAKGVVELAHHQKLRDGHKQEFMAALDRVLAVSQDPVTRDRATRYKEGKTWERR